MWQHRHMDKPLTKRQVLTRLGMSHNQLAGLFNISRQAIDKWPEDEPLSANRWRELRYTLRPDVFNKRGNWRS
jgi:transcriptional regulator with XRE-family HTH domain